MARKKCYHWGCWVTWDDGDEDWGWEAGASTSSFCPTAFCYNRESIMPLVREWRSIYNIKKAVSRRVCLDDLV